MNQAPGSEVVLTRSGPAWRAVASLAAFAAVAGLVVGLTWDATRDRIAANEAERVLAELTAVLPPALYDNEPHRDTRLMVIGTGPAQPVYRARRQGRPTAAVISVEASDGYVGPIRLLVGIDVEGRVLGVRVTSHTETPGIGDAIDSRRSDWIRQFDGRSLDAPAGEQWQLSRDGGNFDAITGATVSSRAVVGATRRALELMRTQRDEIFAP